MDEARAEAEYLGYARRHLEAICKRLGQDAPALDGVWYALYNMPEVVEGYCALYLDGEEGREFLMMYSRPGAERL